jgi:hypothetical protein
MLSVQSALRPTLTWSIVGLSLAPQNPTGTLDRGNPTRRLWVRYLDSRTRHSETQGSRKHTGNCQGPGLGAGSDTQRDLDRDTSRQCIPDAVPVTIHTETHLGTNRDTPYRRSRIVPMNPCGTLHAWPRCLLPGTIFCIGARLLISAVLGSHA